MVKQSTPAIERKKQTRKDLQEPEECEVIEKKPQRPKTKKQLDALKLGRELRQQNLRNKARPKEVLEEVEEEPKQEHKVKSKGVTKKTRHKQKIIIESSSDDESSSGDEIIVKRVSRRSKTRLPPAEPQPQPQPEPQPQPDADISKRLPDGHVNKLLLMRSMGF